MRRLARHILNLLTVLSLLLFIPVALLALRQGRGFANNSEVASVYLKFRHARYTLVSDANGLTLYGPPPSITRPGIL